MPDTTLEELLDRNARHVAGLADDHFDAVQAGQEPAAVSVCCSDSRVSQEGMWSVDEPGWLFTPSSIGNQVWDDVDGRRVVDGSVLYPIAHTDTTVAVVVGHTGCGAITAALETVRQDGSDQPPGIAKRIQQLEPVIEAGLDDGRVREGREASLVDQLVEFNVDRQVAFLRESNEVPDVVTVLGFVYDLHGVYSDERGRTILVNADGETDTDRLRRRVPDDHADWVRRLLE